MAQDHSPLSAERLARRGRRVTLLFVALAAVVLLGGGWLLARTQARQREDLRARFGARATVASTLIDSLFQLAFLQQAQRAGEELRGRLSPAAMHEWAQRNQNVYAAVLRPDGSVLAASGAAPAQPAPDVLAAALRRGAAVSDVIAHPGGEVVESALRFTGADGPRVLIVASPAATYRTFLSGSLRSLTPVVGGAAYILDGRDQVIGAAGADRSRPPPAISATLARRSRADASGTYQEGGRESYFARSPLRVADWRVVIVAPTSALYDPVDGIGRWAPWLILAALAAALAALATLMRRVLASSGRIAAVNAELARSNADLEQFAYAASHDLSSPLRAVAGFAELLATRYGDRLDRDGHEFLGYIRDGVCRMQRIIDDLLAYSRVERGELAATRIDLDAILAEVRRSLGPEIAERRARVTAEALGEAWGDPGQVAQVLQNLLSNALKFTAPGVAPEVHVSARPLGHRVRVSVSDNGIGVDPAQADRVFAMFGRLHGEDAYPGTGIGLAIVQRIVERHGGSVAVQPAPGAGSVFHFDLPAQPPA